MSEEQHYVLCPQCGNSFKVKTLYRALQPRGMGAKYASQITRLSAMHKKALKALVLLGAKDFNSGAELTDVWAKVRELCFAGPVPEGKTAKVPTKQGLSGRLSELQGLHLTSCYDNRIRLEDPETMKFRGRKHFQRWFLSADRETVEHAIETGSPALFY